MLITVICGDLIVRNDDERLTTAEAGEREAHREALVRLLSEISVPVDDPSAKLGLSAAA